MPATPKVQSMDPPLARYIKSGTEPTLSIGFLWLFNQRFFCTVIFGAGLDSYPISRPHSVSTQCRHLPSNGFKLVTRRPHLHQLINIIWLVICVAPGQEHHFPIRVKVHGELQLILVVKKEVANVYNFNLRTVFFKSGSKLARPLTKGKNL